MSNRGVRRGGRAAQEPRDESFLDRNLRVRFVNLSARDKYVGFLGKTPIHERFIDPSISDGEIPFFRSFMSKHNWGIIHEPSGSLHNELVAQFYANIHEIDNVNYSFKTMVGSTVCVVNRSTVSQLVNVPTEGERFPLAARRTLGQLSELLFNKDLVENNSKICVIGAGIHLKVAAKLIVANMMPSSCDNNLWTRDVAEFIFHILEERQLDFCGVIVRSMINIGRGGNRKPGLGCLISRICSAQGIGMIGVRRGGPLMFCRSSIEKMRASTIAPDVVQHEAEDVGNDVSEIDLLRIELADTKEELAYAKEELAILKEQVEYAEGVDQTLIERFYEIRRDYYGESD